MTHRGTRDLDGRVGEYADVIHAVGRVDDGECVSPEGIQAIEAALELLDEDNLSESAEVLDLVISLRAEELGLPPETYREGIVDSLEKLRDGVVDTNVQELNRFLVGAAQRTLAEQNSQRTRSLEKGGRWL